MSFIPKFASHQILKSNMLKSLYDNPYNYLKVYYKDYGEGLISGFDVDINDGRIYISEGILKYNNEIYIVENSTNVEIKNGSNFIYLDIKTEETLDGTNVVYSVITEKQENTAYRIELFRYYKSESSSLRKPQNFNEILVEASNTINYAHSKKAIKYGQTIRDEVFFVYANDILQKKVNSPKDIAFCYHCINGITSYKLIQSYLGINADISNEEVLNLLSDRLKSNDFSEPVAEKPMQKPIQRMEID